MSAPASTSSLHVWVYPFSAAISSVISPFCHKKLDQHKSNKTAIIYTIWMRNLQEHVRGRNKGIFRRSTYQKQSVGKTTNEENDILNKFNKYLILNINKWILLYESGQLTKLSQSQNRLSNVCLKLDKHMINTFLSWQVWRQTLKNWFLFTTRSVSTVMKHIPQWWLFSSMFFGDVGNNWIHIYCS